MAGHLSPRAFPAPSLLPISSETRLFWLALARRLALPALCLGGFALRLHLLSAFPFREDEAMYSIWALHLWRVDPLALTLWPDKPPLFLWLLGGAFQLFGPSEAAARFLNSTADTVTIAVVAATARHLWNRRAGFFAATAYTLNPFAISFAPTAYTDPTLVLWGMLALYTALTRRGFWAGLFLAGAIATKQQGIFYAPLVVGVLFFITGAQRDKADDRRQSGDRDTPHSQLTIHHSPFTILPSVLVGFALLFLPILLWDASRWAVAPSPWDLSVRNYAPLLVLPPDEWLARAAQWGKEVWFFAGSWWVIGYWGLGIGDWIVRGGANPPTVALAPAGRCPEPVEGSVTRRRWTRDSAYSPPPVRDRRGAEPWVYFHRTVVVMTRRLISNLQYPMPIILLWTVGFVCFHIVTSVQIWDRYLLPLAPLLALGMGWLGQHLIAAPTERNRGASAFALRVSQALALAGLLFLLPPALTAARGGLPVGGDHGDYAGLNENIRWLRENAPGNAIVYHRDIGWQVRFAFFAATPDEPDASDFELRWFPNAVYLADNAAKTPERRKFLIEPAWAAVDSPTQRLAQRAIGWEVRQRAYNFTLYELTSPLALPCGWCLCVDRSRHPSVRDFFTLSPGHPFTPSGVQP